MFGIISRTKKVKDAINCAEASNTYIFQHLQKISGVETKWLYHNNVDTMNMITAIIIANTAKFIQSEKTKKQLLLTFYRAYPNNINDIGNYSTYISKIDNEIEASENKENAVSILGLYTGIWLSENVKENYFLEQDISFSEEYLLEIGRIIFSQLSICLSKIN